MPVVLAHGENHPQRRSDRSVMTRCVGSSVRRISRLSGYVESILSIRLSLIVPLGASPGPMFRVIGYPNSLFGAVLSGLSIAGSGAMRPVHAAKNGKGGKMSG